MVAVLHRTSFGVSGVEAAERYGVTATVLSTFVTVQLVTYALMQVPSGLLLDRFGSRSMIAAGAVLMAVGQAALAATDSLGWAYLGRVLIGMGDAATFVSVVRLVAWWFPARRVPLLTQLTGVLGQVGQVVSAFGVVAVLGARGWTVAFGGLAAVGAMSALLTVLAVRDRPGARDAGRGATGLLGPIRDVVSEPGTWLGFWSHAVSQFPLNVFLLLWGFPFLLAQGLTETAAGAVISVAAVSSAVAGPVLGVLSGRHPLRRSWLVLTAACGSAAAWALVLLWPGRAPVLLLVVLAAALGVGGPASLVGFDFARTFNAPQRLGTATGLVNGGGFLFAVVAMLAVGVALDAHPGPALSLESFRVAFAVQAVPWLVAVLGVVVLRRRTRARMAESGVVVPPVREALARRRALRAARRAARAGRRSGGPGSPRG